MTQTINVYDTSVATWSNDQVESQEGYPAKFRTVKFPASTTIRKGEWLAEVTATRGTYAVYNHANSDGTQLPTAISPRAYVTDSNGNIFEGAQASMETVGLAFDTVPVLVGGCFRQTDLQTTTATTLADIQLTFPGAAVLKGTIAGSNAYIMFP